MDLNSFHQLIAGISLALAAGLTQRPVQQAPHFHFPVAASCEEEVSLACSGWPGWAVGLAVIAAYILGSIYPPSRIGRGLITHLVHWINAASPAPVREPPSLFQD